MRKIKKVNINYFSFLSLALMFLSKQKIENNIKIIFLEEELK
jgi:hypothetical protein